MIDMEELRVEVPENFGRRMSFGVFDVRDIFVFVIVFVVFIAIALIIPNVWGSLGVVIFGLIVAFMFAFWKIDNLDFYAYLNLKIKAKNKIPEFPPLYLYNDETTLFNGRGYFRIIEANNGLPLEFMSVDGQVSKLKVYEQMLHACDFPLQFVVKTKKVKPEVFDTLIKEKNELAEGYRKLIHGFTENLYLQFYYVVVPVFTWELRSGDERVRFRRARDMLDIRTKIVLEYLNQLGIGGNVLKGKARIYEVIRGSVS